MFVFRGAMLAVATMFALGTVVRADAEKAPAEKPAEPKPDEPKTDEPKAKTGDSAAASSGKPGEWNQWGGSAQRNNVVTGNHIPTEWDPGQFDRKTGKWKPETAKNIKWVSPLGSQTYGNTVVASGKVWLGTNNSNGYLKRYPADIDLGVLVCFNEADGKFLWQHSSEKLPTGRVHDWPLQGICCSPLVEGDRLWFVTSRGEVRCLDTEGFHDGKDDGRPEKEEPARLFDVRRADDPAHHGRLMIVGQQCPACIDIAILGEHVDLGERGPFLPFVLCSLELGPDTVPFPADGVL